MSQFEYIRQFTTKDGVPFTLRPANPSDRNTVVANIQSVCAEQIYLASDTFIPTEDWKQAFANSVDEKSGCLLLLTQVDDQVVGHLRLFSPWYGAKGRHVGEIGIALLDIWRERGIGKSMMGYALDWAKVARFEKLTASIFSTNQRALNLFLLYNFVQEGCCLKQYFTQGQYFDEVLLGRFLSTD